MQTVAKFVVANRKSKPLQNILGNGGTFPLFGMSVPPYSGPRIPLTTPIGTKARKKYHQPITLHDWIAMCLFERADIFASAELTPDGEKSFPARVKSMLRLMLQGEAVSLHDWYEGVLLDFIGPEAWLVADLFLSKYPPVKSDAPLGQSPSAEFSGFPYAVQRVLPLVRMTRLAIKAMPTYEQRLYKVKLQESYRTQRLDLLDQQTGAPRPKSSAAAAEIELRHKALRGKRVAFD